MVAPLVNYGKEVRSPGYRKIITGARQRAPYNIDTGCEIRTYYVSDSWSWSEDSFPSVNTEADNKARNRLVGQLGDSSSFGATATAEGRQTFGMVTSVIIKAATAARQVRKLDFRGAARTLDIPYSEKTVTMRRRRSLPGYKGRKTVIVRRRMIVLPDGRTTAKSLAGGWLMYSYGVKPLMQDIYNGMDVLQRPLPYYQKIIGSGKARRETSYRYELGQPWWFIRTFTFEASTRTKCLVSVNNPNLHLANQLGLLNPVQWINEAIPLSFIVDWFSNLSQVISQLTDFTGLTVSRPVTTRHYTGIETTADRYGKSYKKFHVFKRTVDLPVAKLQFAYERFNWQRGLNAISLLVGQIKS